MAASYQILARRPGRFYCFLCDQYAVWKGEVAGYFNTGRACNDHKADLVDVTKNMAEDWRP
jgi:hypothetical protein